MFFRIIEHEPIVEECEGCVRCGLKIIGGGKEIICHRHPQPRTRWWFMWKCEDYIKKD